MDREQQGNWPTLLDLFGPDPPRKVWFGPVGDSELLVHACKEIQQYSSQGAWTAEHEAALMGQVTFLATSFRFHQWLEWPAVSKTQLHKNLQAMSDQVTHLRRLVLANPSAAEMASQHYPGSSDLFWELILKGLSQLATAFEASLADGDFQQKGRPKSSVNANVILVLDTRDLMGKSAGHLPGFSREIDASPGPLVRSVKAIYHYATGQPAKSFDRYIVQAERACKKNASMISETNLTV
jgi:hypothetical protein